MTATADLMSRSPRPGLRQRVLRLIADPAFQARAARIPLLRRIVRSEGEAMFDLVAGFCHSQVLLALVRLDLPAQLLDSPAATATLAARSRIPLDRMTVLLNAAASLGLLRRSRDLWSLTTRGAALAGVPGLQGMIAHHDVLYRDLTDPVAFFRGEVETELAAFWPYVFGAGGATDPDVTATYSALMADSQRLVAADTIAAIDWSASRRVMDVGGGTGAFLTALGTAQPHLHLTLFDLPAVAPAATDRFAADGLTDRSTIVTGSFRDDSLPAGADTITLVRVLYDHAGDTVLALLRAAHAALPPGGRLVISEPMTGGSAPARAGDAYFALYCMAMRTGRARSAAQITALLGQAGFTQAVTAPAPARPFVTSVLTTVRLD
ncbi:acetylserotonin O-methyltransferase [Loktanella sp. M215]|uniref:acetylserotonin O-methyltransferase n=1 Tax=Loktanella sp. M215 TaxID=2675431 RepID=UPI001F22A0A0|nr:acetylserotonin O-methyltransferase [Loktanella sp. M215]MCF7698880.1 methyltransferase domain-containing protein [Loktanella sp. M215]